jgi:hypothetical protein
VHLFIYAIPNSMVIIVMKISVQFH